MNSTFGIVIPTRGDRLDLLRACLDSLVNASISHCCVVTSPSENFDPSILPDWVDHVVAQKAGVVHAINTGFDHLLKEYGCTFISWLGDDDELKPGESKLIEILQADSRYVAGVGACSYVDKNRRQIFILKPRQRDVAFLEMFHNRLPQPGSVFKAEALLRTGFLNPDLKFAFDQDLFHRMKRVGRIATAREVVSQYMWHSGSLSSLNQNESVTESHLLRMAHGTALTRAVARMYYALFRALSQIFPPRLR